MNTKVQKKSKNATCYALEMLEKENIKQAIKQILTDYIIFFRVDNSLCQINNVFDPNKITSFDWNAEGHFSGYHTIYMLLNINDNDELCEILGNLTFDTIYRNKECAESLSEKLILTWDREIKNYFTTKTQQ